MDEMTTSTQVKQMSRRAFSPMRLPDEECIQFAAKSWCAISFVGPLETVPRHLGDTEGLAPIAPRLASDWADKMSAQIDRASPIFAQGLLFRLWLETKADAKRLLVELPAFFASRATKLRGDWYGLPPGFDTDVLMIELLDFAASRGLRAFDDEVVVKQLRDLTAVA